MKRDRKLRILVSNPNYSQTPVYLPGIFGILRASVPAELDHRLEWLPPVFFSPATYGSKQHWDFTNVDLLAISNYVWNREFNFHLARIAKQQNPQIVVVAGGPDPSYCDPLFFNKFAAIDAVVVQDADIPFGAIVAAILKDSLEASVIPGVLHRSTKSLLPAALPSGQAFNKSYWLDSQNEYEQMIREIRRNPDALVILPFETDRGCPFNCSFCDWGSNTFSKMRQFPMDRIFAEIDWIGTSKLEMVVITNSNFGIFERDIQIAEKFAEAKRTYGYPREVAYSLPKTDLRYAVEILKIFAQNKMMLYNSVPFQSTSKAVLDAVQRKPLAPVEIDRYIEVSRETETDIHPQLILGQPGDTYETFLQSLADLADKRIFDGVAIYPFLVLPNAPAHELNYRRRWKIETIWRPMGQRLGSEAHPTKCEHCIETSTYTRSDYVQMWALGCIFQALLDVGILRFPMLYLNIRGVAFVKLLSDFQNHFFGNPDWKTSHQLYNSLLEHLETFVCSEDEGQRKEIYFEEVGVEMEPHEFFAMEILFRLDEVMAEAQKFFAIQYEGFTSPELTIDLWRFQKNSLVLPGGDPIVGNEVLLNYNWGTFFSSSRGHSTVVQFPKPTRCNVRHKPSSNALNSQFTFNLKEGTERLSRYFYDCISSNYLKPRVLLESFSQGSQ